MTSSTSYCLYDTLMDPWYVCMYVWLYVCMHVRIYVCVYMYVCITYICMCVCMYVCVCTPADIVTSIKILFIKILGGNMKKILSQTVPKFVRWIPELCAPAGNCYINPQRRVYSDSAFGRTSRQKCFQCKRVTTTELTWQIFLVYQ
jgi:hypothetical protein